MSTRIQDDPNRRCLKVEEWQEVDQQHWRTMLHPGGLFDDDGRAAHWAPATIEKNRKGYGRWLGRIGQTGELDPGVEPWERVTPTRVSDYVKHLQNEVAPYTVIGRLNELSAVMQAMAPDEDWSWLNRAISHLKAARPRAREKQSRLRPSRTLFRTAIKELRRINPDGTKGSIHKAVRYRDTLIVALLASRPLRRSNLAAMRIGSHLVDIGDGYKIVFESDEMKNRKFFETGVNKQLSPFIDRYIADWRPLLLKDKKTDRLWVSLRGQPMSGHDIYLRVTANTKVLFGQSMNPHLFRDAMATSVAIEDPENVRIIMALNGHSSLRTDERYYIQAGSIDAGRQYHAMIRERRQLAKRRKNGGTPQ